MSEIKVGDMVMIVRACCGDSAKHIGEIFVARTPRPFLEQCFWCKKKSPAPYFANDKGVQWASWRLRKIDPDQASDREREFDRLNRRQPEVA